MADRYVVCAPLVNVKTQTRDGVRMVGLNDGSPIPADVDPVSLKHLLSHGLIKAVKGPAPAAPGPAPSGVPAPAAGPAPAAQQAAKPGPKPGPSAKA